MLTRVLVLVLVFYAVGAALMIAQRRGTRATTRTTWGKYASYGLYLALMLLVAHAGAVAFAVLICGVLVAALLEFSRAAGLAPAPRAALVVGGLALALAALSGGALALYQASAGLTLAALVVGALAADPQAGARAAMWAVTGIVAVAMPGAHLLLFADDAQRFGLFAFLFLVVGGADAFAELAGRRWPVGQGILHASPRKSVGGLVGGLVGALALALAVQMATNLWSPLRAAAYGVIVAVAATAGDLVASSLKRTLGIKDFSAALPGHGGVLDRTDSLLFAALPFYWLMTA